MATPATRAQFKLYCLRKLGFPVIEINIDDDQLDDRIDDALAFFQDYHFDGTEKMYMKHQITSADINRRWVYAPDSVTFVTGVFPLSSPNTTSMFDLRYQIQLHDLNDFSSVSYVNYEITMQHLRTLELMFSGTPQFRFNRKQNKVFLDIDWAKDVRVGDYVIIECYRSLNPDTVTLTGTMSYTAGSNVVTGYGTTFDQEFLENDFITFNGVDSFQVDKLSSPTTLTIRGPMVSTAANVTATITGNSDVWGDRFLKKYAYALVKFQIANNLKKFSGVQLPGGITLNGKEMYDEAVEEIAKLEEEMHIINILPSEILVG